MNNDARSEVQYRNYLQSPLQPLADNLEAATYETFENDSIKYELYEKSMQKAFRDIQKYGHFQQTKGACIVRDPPLTASVAEETKDVEMQSIDNNSNVELPYKD